MSDHAAALAPTPASCRLVVAHMAAFATLAGPLQESGWRVGPALPDAIGVVETPRLFVIALGNDAATLLHTRRARARHRGAAIIAVSGRTNTSFARLAGEAGADGFLAWAQAPYRLAALAAMLIGARRRRSVDAAELDQIEHQNENQKPEYQIDGVHAALPRLLKRP